MIPLFPLNTTLFPTTPIFLHIFEERYQQMLEDCLTNGTPMGIILIKEGKEAFDENVQTFSVGTTAKIQQVQRLPANKYNLMALGETRFHIRSINRQKPYLQAEIEEIDLLLSEKDTEPLRQELQKYVLSYLENLEHIPAEEKKNMKVPDESLRLAYFAAHILQIDLHSKQEILCINEEFTLLKKVLNLYRDHTTLGHLKSQFKQNRDYGPFSQN